MSSRPAAAAAAAAAAASIDVTAAADDDAGDDTDYSVLNQEEPLTAEAQKRMLEYHRVVQNGGIVPFRCISRGPRPWHRHWCIPVDTKSVGKTPLECALMHPDSGMLPEVLMGLALPRGKDQTKAVVAGLRRLTESELAELALVTSEVATLVARAVDADKFNVEGPVAASFYRQGHPGFESVVRVLGPERVAIKCFTAAVKSVRYGVRTGCFVHRLIEALGVTIGIGGGIDAIRFTCPDHPNVALHPVIAYAVMALPVPQTMEQVDWCFESGRLPKGYEFCFNAAFAALARPMLTPHLRAPETWMKEHPEMLLRRHPNYGVDAVEFMMSPDVAKHCGSWDEYTLHASLKLGFTNGIPPWKISGQTDDGKACVIAHDDRNRSDATAVVLGTTFHTRCALIDTKLGRISALMTIILEYLMLPVGVKYDCAWINDVREMALDMLSTTRGYSKPMTTNAAAYQQLKPVPGTKRVKRTPDSPV